MRSVPSLSGRVAGVPVTTAVRSLPKRAVAVAAGSKRWQRGRTALRRGRILAALSAPASREVLADLLDATADESARGLEAALQTLSSAAPFTDFTQLGCGAVGATLSRMATSSPDKLRSAAAVFPSRWASEEAPAMVSEGRAAPAGSSPADGCRFAYARDVQRDKAHPGRCP